MTGPLRRSAMTLATALLATALTGTPSTATAATSPGAPPPSDRALAAQPARHDLTREQFYLALPDRFANGDASNDRGGLTGTRMETGFDPTDRKFFQGGDLKGLTERLDYIKGLGTTALWMAPVFTNIPVQDRGDAKDATAGYHGYWITDFTRVDPHFGTNEDLRTLVDTAHAMGMKVFFDVITNHTADTVDYAEKEYGYRPKGAFPYLDSAGRPFDDTAEAPGSTPTPSRTLPSPRHGPKCRTGSTTPPCTTTGATPPSSARAVSTATSSATTTCGRSVPRSSRA